MPVTPRPSRALPLGLLVVAVVLVSVNLRPGASSVGPVLAEVRDGLGMSATAAGAITGLPGLCFALGGALAVRLGRRAGITTGILLGLVLATVGLLTRVLTGSVAVFLALTMLALVGMAVGNVLVPAWIKGHANPVRLMTVYGTGLIVGGALGSLLAAPLTGALGGWRQGLGVWAVVAATALPLWLWLARHERRSPAEHTVEGDAPDGRIAHSPTAVALTALFGIQSTHAYIQMGWLPQIYRDAGLSATYAGALQAALAGVGILGGLLMPTVIDRGRGLSRLMLTLGVLLVAGYAGLLFAPATLPWLWALLLGVAGYAFTAAIALITARTRDPRVTARLSGFVQPVGYLLAAAGPFVVGLIHDATGDWNLVLWLLIASAIPFTWAGLRAVRPAYVDDEIG